MKRSRRSRQRSAGFSLIELALVLVVAGLLAGGLLPTLAMQREMRQREETQHHLEQARDALLGFVALHGRLPCADTDTDPAAAGWGEEEADCTAAAPTEGFLPFRTLGVSGGDAWGNNRLVYRVDRSFASQQISLERNFSDDRLRVVDHQGATLTTDNERPVAILLSFGKNLVADGENAAFESAGGTYQNDVPTAEFDDQAIWLSRPSLAFHLAQSGRIAP
jgi:prepilin-type N-terminal cleavage/methylation domain-containing protein